MLGFYDSITVAPTAIDRSRKPEEVDSSFGDFLAVGARETSVGIGYKAIKRYQETSEAEKDLNVLEKDDLFKQQIYKDYSKREADYLLKSDTKHELEVRKLHVNQDRETVKQMSRLGFGGSTTAILLGALFDPINLVSFGAVGAVKTSRTANAIRLGAVAGAENALLEGVNVASSTHNDFSDVVIAGLAGITLGGVIGGIRTPKNIDQSSNKVANAFNKDARELLSNPKQDRMDVEAGDDASAIQTDINRLMDQVNSEIKNILKPRQIDEVLDELSEIESLRARHTEEFNLSKNEATGADPKAVDIELQKLDARARELENKLGMHERGIEARDFKGKWKSWSSKKQLKRLYGDKKVPSVDAKLKGQRVTKTEGLPKEEGIEAINKDPRYQTKLKRLTSETEKLKKSEKARIEEKYNCEVLI